MIQLFGQKRNGRVTRKGIAVLLTFWLNLALLPCAMAVEVPETGHDCCPSTLEMQQIDCCELDSAADKRASKFEAEDDFVVISTAAIWPSLRMANLSLQTTRPPDPENSSPPLHKLFCVYLD